MATNNRGNRYDEDFKRTLVNLYQSGDKSQAALCKRIRYCTHDPQPLDQTILYRRSR